MAQLYKLYRIYLFIILVTLGGCTACGEVCAASESTGTVVFAYGSGTESDPYQITHIEHLNSMRDQLDKHYILMNDLDFSSAYDYLNSENMAALTVGDGWVPIGSKAKMFHGNFNANGHIIKGLRINRNTDYQGLFGYTSNESRISNGRLKNASIKGGLYTGALAGSNSGNITNFSVEGVVNGSSFVGGLVGENKGTIIGASMVGSVIAANNHVGGLVGYTEGGSIHKSNSLVTVKGKGLVGGLVGNHNNSVITNSYTLGSISVEKEYNYAGGLVGLVSKGQIQNCYAAGQLQGFGNVGGLIGYCNSSPQIINSYYDSTLSGYYDNGKGDPKTTAEMKSAETFSDWEFEGEDAIWSIVNTPTHYSYPYLVDNTQSYPGHTVRASKLITAFQLSQLTPSVNGVINQENKTITVAVPYGTDVSNLAPTIAYEGKEISPNPEIPQNFTDPFEYTVMAQDESCQAYTITVTIKERDPVIVSIDEIENIAVTRGTDAEQAITALPKTTIITDSNGDTHSVLLEWVLIDYDGSLPGDYKAEAAFVLPIGIHQSYFPIELKVAAIIKVEPQSMVPPAKPPFWPDDSLLTAEYIKINKSKLNWTEARDDQGVTGYRIYKEGMLIGEVSGDVHSYLVTGLLPSTSYIFQVQAGDEDGIWTNNGPCLNIQTPHRSHSWAGENLESAKKIYSAHARVNYYDNEIYSIQTEHHAKGDEIIVRIEQSILNKFMKQVTADKKTQEIIIEISPVLEAGTYTLQLPGQSLSAEEHLVNITFITPIATLIIPDNMLSYDAYDEAQELSLSIRKSDNSRPLNELVQNMTNCCSIIELYISIDKHPKDWFNTSAPVTVTLPAFVFSNQITDPEYFIVCYLDKNHKLSFIQNAFCHTDSNRLTFKCIRSGAYAGIYNYKSFMDLADYSWAKKPIEVLASKGILAGTSQDCFSPGDKILRADFLIMLLNTLGITAGFESNFSDVHEDDYYEALGIAKQYKPLDYISRQDMIDLAVRALKFDKKLSELSLEPEILNRYQDRNLINPYAYESLEIMVSEGAIKGYANMLNPQDDTTRAEAAVFLYEIYKKYYYNIIRLN